MFIAYFKEQPNACSRTRQSWNTEGPLRAHIETPGSKIQASAIEDLVLNCMHCMPHYFGATFTVANK